MLDSQRAPLRRIVLETSGLSKPGPILRGLASLAPLRLRVSVVATFDCLRWCDVAGFEEAAAQWAGAQALVLTRRDLASRPRSKPRVQWRRGVNPLADIIDFDDRHACVARSIRPARRLRATPSCPNGAGPRASAYRRHAGSLDDAKPAWDDLAAWLDNLAGLLGERLLRVKGVVAVAEFEQPCSCSRSARCSVRHAASQCRRTRPFLVVIARDASPDEVAQVTPIMPIGISLLGAPDPFARRAAGSLRAF